MLDKTVKICAIIFLAVWSIAGIIFITSSISLMQRLTKSSTAPQAVSASKLTQTQVDCLKSTWGEDVFNKYKNDLRKTPTDLQQKALPCFQTNN